MKSHIISFVYTILLTCFLFNPVWSQNSQRTTNCQESQTPDLIAEDIKISTELEKNEVEIESEIQLNILIKNNFSCSVMLPYYSWDVFQGNEVEIKDSRGNIIRPFKDPKENSGFGSGWVYELAPEGEVKYNLRLSDFYKFPPGNYSILVGRKIGHSKKRQTLKIKSEQIILTVKENDNVDAEKLLIVIRDKTLIETNSAKVIAAIDKLGELKVEKAVDDLAKLLTLDRGKQYFDKENPPAGGIITKLTIYPAAGALFAIGQPAVPALLKVIETEESDSLAGENALYVLTMMNAANLERAVEILREKITTAENGEGAQRLLKAAQKIEDSIAKKRAKKNQ